MLKGFSHIELYVGNIFQSTLFYENIFGFTCSKKTKISAMPTDQLSSLITQENAALILTSPIKPACESDEFIKKHADSVKDIIFRVENVHIAFERAVKSGAEIVKKPWTVTRSSNKLNFATVKFFGNIQHTLTDVSTASAYFKYNSQASVATGKNAANKLVNKIDHIAFCTESGTMLDLVEKYANAFDMHISHMEDVDTGKSGMKSKVIESGNSNVKLVFTEPCDKYKKSQIKDFIHYNASPGVQHVAFETSNILAAVEHLKTMGMTFLEVPSAYYDMQKKAFPKLKDKIESLRFSNILVDQDKFGYLYQIFTQPVHTRPTLFFEFIQRDGAEGFGSNNIKTLFKSIESAQDDH